MRRCDNSDNRAAILSILLQQFLSSIFVTLCIYGTLTVMFAVIIWPLFTRGGPYPRIDVPMEEQPLSPYFYLYGEKSWPIIIYSFIALPLISLTMPKNFLCQQLGVTIIGTCAAYFLAVAFCPSDSAAIIGVIPGLIASALYGRCSLIIWSAQISD